MTSMIPPSTSQRGHTALELLLVGTLVATLAAMAVPLTSDSLDDARAEAAARYLAARFALARGQAARRSARVAIRFERRDADYVYATYLDGNRNGVLTRDIQSGIDLPLTPLERLSDRFSGVQFGVMRGLSPIEPGEQLSEGDDPVRARLRQHTQLRTRWIGDVGHGLCPRSPATDGGACVGSHRPPSYLVV